MSGARSEASEAKLEFGRTNEKVQPELPESTAPVVAPEIKSAAERVGTNEMIQPEIADGTVAIVDPDSKAAAEGAQTEDARVETTEARVSTEDARVGTNERGQL
jgi:hypothetical protein